MKRTPTPPPVVTQYPKPELSRRTNAAVVSLYITTLNPFTNWVYKNSNRAYKLNHVLLTIHLSGHKSKMNYMRQ